MPSPCLLRLPAIPTSALLLSLLFGHAAAEVLSAPAPQGEPLSARFTVSADGQNVPVYVAKVFARPPEGRVGFNQELAQPSDWGETGFASFDLRGGAEVTVTCAEAIRDAHLLPTASGIVPTVSGNRATFTVWKPGQFCLEVNGEWVDSLQLFVNPWQSDVPKSDDPNVIYFGPGVHRISGLQVLSGKTVYVADGAVLYGEPPGNGKNDPVVSLKGDHIVFRGRGIVDGSLCPLHTRNLFFVSGTDISIEGIVLRDSSTWTLPVRRSQGVKIANVKVFGHRANSDGIDICNSRDVDVADSFLRTYDDLIVVKSDLGQGEVRNVTAERCVLWNEIAHALSVGAEIRDPVDGVRFSDCDIIHDKGREWLLRVYHCDAAPVKNVVFENIRVEEARRLISVWIGKAVWSRQLERGHVEEVTFRAIQSVRPREIAVLEGFDADHAIHGVHFQDVTIGGKPLLASEVKRNDYVTGVEIRP